MPRVVRTAKEVSWTDTDEREFDRLQSKDDKEGLTGDEILAANSLFERKITHLYQSDPVIREVKDSFLQGVDVIIKMGKRLSKREGCFNKAFSNGSTCEILPGQKNDKTR